MEHGDGELHVYRYPEIGAGFRSEAHSPENLLSQFDERGFITVLSRACKGLTPITTIEIAGLSASVLRQVPAEGMELREDAGEPVVIAMTGIVGDRLDVETLIAAWARYLQESPMPAVLGTIERELRRVAKLPFAVFENTQWADASALVQGDVGGLARAGLLYGYPPESTAAMIGEGLGIPGCAHAIVNPEPEFAELVCDGAPPGRPEQWTEPPFLGQLRGVARTGLGMDAQGAGSRP